LANYDDGSFDIYTCPVCTEEYTEFEDMMACWKLCVGFAEKESAE
jgi:hypothetical protein